MILVANQESLSSHEEMVQDLLSIAHTFSCRLHAAAINILDRDADSDIGLWTPHRRVKQIIQERADRQRSRLPDQDSSTEGHCRCGERNIRNRSTLIKK
jgi:hypothetical protein